MRLLAQGRLSGCECNAREQENTMSHLLYELARTQHGELLQQAARRRHATTQSTTERAPQVHKVPRGLRRMSYRHSVSHA